MATLIKKTSYVTTPLFKVIIPYIKSRGMNVKEVDNDVILAMPTTKKFVGVKQVAAMSLFLASDSGLNLTGASFSINFCWTAK